MKKASNTIPGLLLLAALLLAGCGDGASSTDPTVIALGTAMAGTATAAQLEKLSVNKLATAQAEADVKSTSIAATQTAQASGRSAAEIAYATQAAPVIAELPVYVLDSSSGRLGWRHDPLTLEINGYQQMTNGNDHPEVTAANFALAADLTWDTQYGSSGCGLMFRSNGDQKKPDGYMILLTRFGSGHVLFTALADGEIANVHDFFPKTADQAFQWQNGSTNRLAVIARGNLIEIYTNGVKIGEVDTTQPPQPLSMPNKPLPPLNQNDTAAMNAYQTQLAEYKDILKQYESMYQTALKNYSERTAVFSDGFLTMIAASESGRTVCTFSDAWLWLIEP